MFEQLFPPGMTDDLKGLAQSMKSAALSLKKIEENTMPTVREDKEPQFVELPIVTTAKLPITGFLISVDTTDLYALKLGDGVYYPMRWYLNSGQLHIVEFGGKEFMTVGRGTKLAIVQLNGGTANVYAQALTYPT